MGSAGSLACGAACQLSASLTSARNRLAKSHVASTVSRAPQGRQAAFLLASALAGHADHQPASRMKCIFIGAGFLGLAAARTLADEGSGVEVIVLKAGTRVGGRAHTAQVCPATPFVRQIQVGATG